MRKSTRAVTLFVLPHFFLLWISSASCTRHPSEPPFLLKQVGVNAWAAIDNARATSPAAANAGFVIGDDAVTVIDTFGSAEAARQLLAEIGTLTKRPVKFVINTHYHLDHVAGNGVFAAAGAVVLAQRNVRSWIHSENLRMFGTHITPELKALTDAVVAPMVVYDQNADLYMGSRQIQLRSLPGHTGSDSFVLIPDSKIVFAGDLFWHNMLPNLIDASTQPWIDTLATLLAQSSPDYTFVPGHGDVGKAADVTAFREYLITLRQVVAAAKDQRQSGSGLAATVISTLKEPYAHWDFSEDRANENISQTDAELSGTKRIPEAESAH
jgi:glyoxylase-like metal-dependent hydrolase (beta-lactamase superfamily II)